jgi:hypothetical protein
MSIISEVDALVSLSRSQSRLAQEYAAWAREPRRPTEDIETYQDNIARWSAEHDRLRMESVRHMRSAYRLRDWYCDEKEAALAWKEAAE